MRESTHASCDGMLVGGTRRFNTQVRRYAPCRTFAGARFRRVATTERQQMIERSSIAQDRSQLRRGQTNLR